MRGIHALRVASSTSSFIHTYISRDTHQPATARDLAITGVVARQPAAYQMPASSSSHPPAKEKALYPDPTVVNAPPPPKRSCWFAQGRLRMTISPPLGDQPLPAFLRAPATGLVTERRQEAKRNPGLPAPPLSPAATLPRPPGFLPATSPLPHSPVHPCFHPRHVYSSCLPISRSARCVCNLARQAAWAIHSTHVLPSCPRLASFHGLPVAPTDSRPAPA